MESAACRSGGGLLRGLYRVIARRNLVYASSIAEGAFLGERLWKSFTEAAADGRIAVEMPGMNKGKLTIKLQIHQVKQDVSRSSLMPLMKCISPFLAGRIQENCRRLSSSSSSALHEAFSSPLPSADDVHLTAACIQRMKELQAAEGSLKEKLLRLSVETGGCSGFQYVFNLDERANSDDRVFEKDGVKLVIDNISYDFVKGATVDYVEELIRAAFQVTANPSAVGGCSCKSSFMVKQ